MSTPHPKRWLAAVAVMVVAMMDLLDSTIAQVAAPTIQRDLGGSYATLEWITAAYGLAMAIGFLTGGRLGDLFGRKRMMLIGVSGFVAASALCGLASTPGELIAFRVLQGLLGSMMLPQVFGLFRDLFGPKDMAKAFAVFGPLMGLSAMLGPIASGALLEADLFGSGWRMIFLVNLPIGAFSLYVGWKHLPSVAPEARGAKLDFGGAVLAAGAMALLVYPLVQGQHRGWPVWILVLLGASVPALAGLAWHLVRRGRNGATPLIEPSLFAKREYVSGVAFSLVFLGALGGVTLILNVLLQAGLGFSPWESAITTAPWALGGFVGSAIGGMTMQRFGRRIVQAGLIVQALGVAGVYVALRTAGTDLGTLDLLAPMILGGTGMGMVFVPLFDVVVAGVEPHEIGSASGVLQSANMLGMSVGVAGLGAIFFALLDHSTAAGDFVAAAEWSAIVTVVLLATAFALAFRLPRHIAARDSEMAPAFA